MGLMSTIKTSAISLAFTLAIIPPLFILIILISLTNTLIIGPLRLVVKMKMM